MIELPAPGQKFITLLGEFLVLKLLGKGKSAYSFLVENSGERFVLKIMHDEPNPYYRFEQNKIDAEVSAYSTLSNLKIPVPKLIHFDKSSDYLVKEFIDGKTAAEMIARNELNEEIFSQLFAVSNTLTEHEINIDYFPTNFVIKEDKLFYIDYEINNYEEKWNLENWGIYYWLNSSGFKNFLASGDASSINSDIDNGIPIKEPFQKQVDDLRERFG